MLFHLIYISKAVEILPETELLQIMSKSRMSNVENQITGMLLYVQGRFLQTINKQLFHQYEGRFIQVLEGTETAVRAKFETIRSDYRHYDLLILKEGELPARSFDHWAMGFRSMELDEYEQLPGFFQLNDESLQKMSADNSGVSLNFLQSFYEMSKSKL